MANQKPIDEVRIGRVKATIWKNGTEDAPRSSRDAPAYVAYNVTFSRLYKDGDQWKSTQSFGRNDLLTLAKVADAAGITTPPFRSPPPKRVAGESNAPC